jgi:hypothetical protein
MDLHTDRMHYFLVANNYYGCAESHDAPIGMKIHETQN